MAPIRATEASIAVTAPPAVPDIGDWREEQAILLGDYDELARMPWSKLRKVEIFPGFALDAEVLKIPEEWMPAGSLRRPGSRRFRPAEAGVPSDPALAETRDEHVRRALYALWLPRNTGSGVRLSKPATWRMRTRAFLRFAKWQLKNHPSADGTVFGALTLLDVLTGLYPTAGGMRPEYERMLAALLDAGERGIISDYPRFFAPRAPDDGDQHEPVRKGAAVLKPSVPTPERTVCPFGDEFVTEFLRRALWIQENIADSYLDHFEADRQLREKLLDRYVPNSSVTNAARVAAIDDGNWFDAKGEPILKLPFQIRYPTRSGPGELSDAWPPPNLIAFNAVAGIVQGCNLGTVNACNGMRSSEILGADVPFETNRYNSTTFKLIDTIGGRERDWPLHPAAVRAIDIQRRLSRLLRPAGTKHLWVTLHGDEGLRLTSATENFRRTVDYLDLGHLLGADTAHMHRWRHTIARLVALSVVGAPKVLFDLFGHNDIEMTLHYMMSDPDIAEEAMLVAKETTYTMVEEAIMQTFEDKASGSASEELRDNLSKAMRFGEEAFDTKSLRETAEVLTWQGRFWSLVRPGVICTKGFAQFGPCTKGRGTPDPGACRTDCSHRLELSIARHQCEETLVALINERKCALADGLDMLVENLNGQIVAELKRWDDVRERVLAENPDLRPLWAKSSTESSSK
jgi:integrase